MKNLKPVFVSGFSSPRLTSSIAEHIGAQVVRITPKQFDDDEIQTTIEENVRGREVVVVASGSGDPNKQEKEARLLMRSARRAGAASVKLFLPYMWYGRSDDNWDERNTPALIDTIETLRELCDSVIVADPHNPGLTRETFLAGGRVKSCTVVHFAYPFAKKLTELFNDKSIDPQNMLLMHADAGSVKRISRSFRHCIYKHLNIDDNPDQDSWAQGLKDRDKATGKSYFKGVSQNVEGKDVVIFEDMISSGGTACELASILKKQGAKSVTLFATTGLFTAKKKSKESMTAPIDRINNSDIDRVFITDTYDYHDVHPRKAKAIEDSPKIHVIKTGGYLGSIIEALHAEPDTEEITDNNSVSAILKGEHPSQICEPATA